MAVDFSILRDLSDRQLAALEVSLSRFGHERSQYPIGHPMRLIDLGALVARIRALPENAAQPLAVSEIEPEQPSADPTLWAQHLVETNSRADERAALRRARLRHVRRRARREEAGEGA